MNKGNDDQRVMCVKTYFARLVLLSLVTTSSWRMFLTWSTSQHVARERYTSCVCHKTYIRHEGTFIITEHKTVYCRFALLAATFSKDTSGEDQTRPLIEFFKPFANILIVWKFFGWWGEGGRGQISIR